MTQTMPTTRTTLTPPTLPAVSKSTIIGGTLGGLGLLSVGMIVLTLVIVAGVYKVKHKRENLSQTRSVSLIGTSSCSRTRTCRHLVLL